MTLTLPTIAPTYYGLTNQAFSLAPEIRNGSPDVTIISIIVPSATATGTLIGVVPFRAGARVSYKGNELYIPDWDTSTNVTFTAGYTYYDSTQGTSNASAFISTSTVGQTAGFASFNTQAGYQFIAAADGWVTITTAGGTTTTSGTIQSEVQISYDSNPVIA